MMVERRRVPDATTTRRDLESSGARFVDSLDGEYAILPVADDEGARDVLYELDGEAAAIADPDVGPGLHAFLLPDDERPVGPEGHAGDARIVVGDLDLEQAIEISDWIPIPRAGDDTVFSRPECDDVSLGWIERGQAPSPA